MEAELLYLSLSILSLLVAFNFIRSKTKRKVENPPPSPPSLPIIGHLHLLKDPLHQTLHNLSQKHGPIISLKFGSRPVFVVASSSAVEECFTSNDIILANRPHLIVGKHVGYNWSTVVNANYGENWRHLRKICSLEILSSNRLNLFAEVRKQEVKNLIGNIYRESNVLKCSSSYNKNKVELRPLLTELPFNILVRMICGKKFVDAEGEEARKFRVLIKEILGVAAASYPGDFLPILRWIDYQGFEKKAKELAKKSDEFFQGLVDEHKDKRRSQYVGLESTMIDRLLSLQESDPTYYSDEVIKGLILALLLAGTDTSSVAMEWAMSLLLNHPDVLGTLKDEINTHVGGHDNRLVEEADLQKLTYLQCVISETLRLYPPTPLLLPHVASQDCKIQGFDMPRDTMVLVNAWAIHRDPNLWTEPEKFKPERFRDIVNKDDDGSYKYIPFGVGRRACPGAGLGNRVMALALASLIQCFDWERPSDEEEIDMTQGRGLTMPKAKPLQAVCRPTPIINHIFSLQT